MSRRTARECAQELGEFKPSSDAFLEELMSNLSLLLYNSGHSIAHLERSWTTAVRKLRPSKQGNRAQQLEVDIECVVVLPQILSLWHSPPYVDCNNKPLDLPLAEGIHSVATLLTQAGSTFSPRFLVNTLQRFGVVKRQGRRFRVLARNMPFQKNRRMASVYGTLVFAAFLRTLANNISNRRMNGRQIELTSINPRFPSNLIMKFSKEFRKLAEAVLWEHDQRSHVWSELASANTPRSDSGLGIYLITDLTGHLRASSIKPRSKRPNVKVITSS